MFITKMHLSRRTVLRGLGATLALPLLDSMVPALTALQQDGGGAGAAARRVLRAERHVDAVLVPEGRRAARASCRRRCSRSRRSRTGCCCAAGSPTKPANLVKGGGDHARSAGTFLTCVPFKITSGADVFAAVSMDQIAAQELAKETQLASLELGIESNAMLGACDGGASCAYTNTIAWRTPTTPLPIENDPRAVFERLFGTSGSTDPRARLARMQRDRSILDFVGERARRACERVIGPQRQGEDRRVSRVGARRRAAHPDGRDSRTRASCRSSSSRSASRPTTPSTPS